MGHAEHLRAGGGDEHCDTPPTPQGLPWEVHRRARRRGLVWGVAASAGLVAVYVGVLALANSMEHAWAEFVRLAGWMIPLVVGFGTQVGLFAYGRSAARSGGPAAAGVAASGGASTVSMVACCAHHLTDVLPLVGLAGAATFLGAYQSTFLLLGVLSNAIGLTYVLGMLRKHRVYPAQRSVLTEVLRVPFDRLLAPIAAISTVALLAFLLVGCGSSADVTDGEHALEAWDTRRSDGEVMFDLTPRGVVDGRFTVDLGVNTHSGDLADLDLQQATVLEAGGKKLEPIEPVRLVGHHARSTLVFALDEAPREFTITITGVRSLGPLRYDWP